MQWLHPIAWFFGGAFLGNAVPHFVSGVRGEPFQSPFAKPPGKGLSSPTVNVLWGFLNLAVGYALICQVGEFRLNDTVDALIAGMGLLAISLFAAWHFGGLRGGLTPNRR
jgi:hypothetical protein